MKVLQTTTAILVGYLVFGACSKSNKTAAPGAAHQEPAVTTTLNDPASETIVKVADGSLKDASVAIPAGSLAVGTKVSLEEGNAPSEFAISDSSVASKPLVVSAAKSAEAVPQTQQAMTIVIPITATQLALTASYANLAALLITTDGKLVIWRRDKIAVLGSNAVFKSKKFGTYQLVLLGGQRGDDFADTEEQAPDEKADEAEDGADGSDSDDDASVATADAHQEVEPVVSAQPAGSTAESTSSNDSDDSDDSDDE